MDRAIDLTPGAGLEPFDDIVDAELVPEPPTEREEQLRILQEANLEGIKGLNQQGIGIAPGTVQSMMFDEFIDALFPEGPERIEFMIRMELRTAKLIQEAPEQARQQRLAQMQQRASGLVVPGR